MEVDSTSNKNDVELTDNSKSKDTLNNNVEIEHKTRDDNEVPNQSLSGNNTEQNCDVEMSPVSKKTFSSSFNEFISNFNTIPESDEEQNNESLEEIPTSKQNTNEEKKTSKNGDGSIIDSSKNENISKSSPVANDKNQTSKDTEIPVQKSVEDPNSSDIEVDPNIDYQDSLSDYLEIDQDTLLDFSETDTENETNDKQGKLPSDNLEMDKNSIKDPLELESDSTKSKNSKKSNPKDVGISKDHSDQECTSTTTEITTKNVKSSVSLGNTSKASSTVDVCTSMTTTSRKGQYKAGPKSKLKNKTKARSTPPLVQIDEDSSDLIVDHSSGPSKAAKGPVSQHSVKRMDLQVKPCSVLLNRSEVSHYCIIIIIFFLVSKDPRNH